MKRWVCEVVLCIGIAFMCSVIHSLFLRWVAGFPRIGPIPLPAASECANTFVTGMWVFAIVFMISMMRVLLRRLKQCVSVQQTVHNRCPCQEVSSDLKTPESDGMRFLPVGVKKNAHF